MGKIATIGFFDGVHKGHQFLFEHLNALASEQGRPALIVTFDAHPRAVLQRGEAENECFVPHLLTTLEERKAILQTWGEVIVFPFEQIQPLTAAEFMCMLHDLYEVEALLMGYDHRFGSDKLRKPQEYRLIGQQTGIEVLTLGEYIEGEFHVSSTEVRQALWNGDIVVANDLLGRPYSISGTVTHGNGIGRTIGFPTANIQPECSEKIIPHNGVYAIRVTGEGIDTYALCNIGTNPTIGNQERTIEVYIPKWTGDLYGRSLSLHFMQFIRDERKFASLQALREQIKEDVSSVLRHCS